MSFIYSDEPRSFSGNLNIAAMNPHKPYRTHLENWYYLTFIKANSKDYREIQQAEKELVICQRKLDYWKRHPSFEPSVGAQITDDVKKMWASRT